MRTFNFCNNCGKNGHLYQSCKEPITSLGVIAFKYEENNTIKYMMICRKDTLGYVDFIRGRYNLINTDYIVNLINVMTTMEKAKILSKNFDDLWKDLWGNNIGIQYRGEETSAKTKFETLFNGYNIANEFINIYKLIARSTTNWQEQEWGFPKGRRNYLEKDIYCALREFSEETGYDSHNVSIINNIIPYEETFIGSNHKCYKHKYYIGNIKNNTLPKNNFQETEVSKIEWKTKEECIKVIRHYNNEKKEIIEKVDKILSKNNLCI